MCRTCGSTNCATPASAVTLRGSARTALSPSRRFRASRSRQRDDDAGPLREEFPPRRRQASGCARCCGCCGNGYQCHATRPEEARSMTNSIRPRSPLVADEAHPRPGRACGQLGGPRLHSSESSLTMRMTEHSYTLVVRLSSTQPRLRRGVRQQVALLGPVDGGRTAQRVPLRFQRWR